MWMIYLTESGLILKEGFSTLAAADDWHDSWQDAFLEPPSCTFCNAAGFCH